MKNRKRTFQDIETLSAYLDDQLLAEEKAKLQSRLQQEAGLRQDLENLRQTRAVLRSTPQVKRPRSFALTPEMVKEQRFVLQAMRFSRMVAVAASVLFAFVFAGQVFLGSMAGSIAMSPQNEAVTAYDQAADSAEMAEMPEVMGGGGPQEGEAPMAMQAAEEESAMEAPEEPQEESMDMADTGLAPEEPQGTMTPPADQTEEPSDDAVAAEEETGIGGGGGEDDASEEAAESAPVEEPAAEQPQPTETVGVESRTMDAEKTTVEEADEAEVLSEDLMDDGDSSDELPMPPVEQTSQIDDTPSESVPVLVWVEGGLLVLAGISGVLFLYFRRRLK